MSEENTTAPEQQVPEVPLPSISIVRNGIELTLSPYKIVKGNRKNQRYLAPTVTRDNIDRIREWFGVDNEINVLLKNVKSTFQDIWFDAFDEKTGEFLQEKFVTEAAKFDVAGLKLKEINDQLDEAVEKQSQLMSSAALDENGQFPVDVTKEMLKLRDTIAALRAMRDERSRKPKADTDAEPAVEVK